MQKFMPMLTLPIVFQGICALAARFGKILQDIKPTSEIRVLLWERAKFTLTKCYLKLS